MATRSTISVHDPLTDHVKQVYCHWDGYLEHNGVMLSRHYNSYELANQLIDMGAISGLEDTIDGSVFYARDRGEERLMNDFYSYEMWRMTAQREEFDYIWINDAWHVINNNDELVPLSKLIGDM